MNHEKMLKLNSDTKNNKIMKIIILSIIINVIVIYSKYQNKFKNEFTMKKKLLFN